MKSSYYCWHSDVIISKQIIKLLSTVKSNRGKNRVWVRDWREGNLEEVDIQTNLWNQPLNGVEGEYEHIKAVTYAKALGQETS